MRCLQQYFFSKIVKRSSSSSSFPPAPSIIRRTQNRKSNRNNVPKDLPIQMLRNSNIVHLGMPSEQLFSIFRHLRSHFSLSPSFFVIFQGLGTGPLRDPSFPLVGVHFSYGTTRILGYESKHVFADSCTDMPVSRHWWKSLIAFLKIYKTFLRQMRPWLHAIVPSFYWAWIFIESSKMCRTTRWQWLPILTCLYANSRTKWNLFHQFTGENKSVFII